MFPTIHLGPLVLPAPTLSILAGIYLALTLLERADRSGKLVNIVLAGLGFGLVCARLGYALRYPAAFLSSPLGLISTNPGMFDPTVGAAGGLALAYGLLRRAKLAVSPALDALTPALAVFAAALALAHLASGDAYGAPANLPWAVDLWGARRHPSQAYELAAALLILAAAWPWPQRQPAAAGLRFWAFIALTALARLFLEGFRGDSTLLWGGLRAAQVIAWLILALSLWQLKPAAARPAAAVSGAAPAGTSAPETPTPAPETPPEG